MDDNRNHAYDGSVADSGDAASTSGAPDFSPLASYDSVYDAAPTSGMQQFWWLADSVPLGRQLVIAVLAIGLVGAGFGIGRLGQRVIVQQISVPVLSPQPAPLPTAQIPTHSHGVVLDATMPNSDAQLATSTLVQYQPRLPWEEYPSEVNAAYVAVGRMNQQVSALNLRSMEEYVQRAHELRSMVRRPVLETYYVVRRTPAYARLASLGDRPSHYLMPGTPLHLDHKQSHWALVIGPSGEQMWIKASVLSTAKTHRST